MGGESRRFWAWFSVLVLASCFCAVMSVFMSVTAHARTKDDAVVVVADPIVLLQIGTEGECTGFISRAFGHNVIVTAGHCATAGEGQTVTAKDSIGRTVEVQAIYFDKVHDLAIFKPTDDHYAGAIQVSKLACDVPVQIGERVSIVGYPLDYGKVTTIGTVAASPSPWNGWPEVYRLNIFAGPGNSGSPVFNGAGDVIGVLVGGNPQWPGMSMAVPVSELCHPTVG